LSKSIYGACTLRRPRPLPPPIASPPSRAPPPPRFRPAPPTVRDACRRGGCCGGDCGGGARGDGALRQPRLARAEREGGGRRSPSPCARGWRSPGGCGGGCCSTPGLPAEREVRAGGVGRGGARELGCAGAPTAGAGWARCPPARRGGEGRRAWRRGEAALSRLHADVGGEGGGGG
jgi:hypothetical protein